MQKIMRRLKVVMVKHCMHGRGGGGRGVNTLHRLRTYGEYTSGGSITIARGQRKGRGLIGYLLKLQTDIFIRLH